MYVKRLDIQNFRCFSETEIELNYPGRRAAKTRRVPTRIDNVNLFLGNNGSGKSSVFKALALGVLAPVIQSSGFQAEYLVQRRPGEMPWLTAPTGSGKAEAATRALEQAGGGNALHANGPRRASAEVRAHLKLHDLDASSPPSKGEAVIGQTVIQRFGDVESIESGAFNNPGIWEQMFFNNSPAFFLVGYGANRRTERPEGYSETNRSPRYQRVASLFEDHVGLAPFNYGCLQLQNRGYFDEAVSILNGLLPNDVNLTERVDEQKRQLFEVAGLLLPFGALSDGFRTFVGWVWDLLLQIGSLQTRVQPGLTEIRVVVVDEIDLFLHPEWQRLVIEQVAHAFSRLQFLFSSHSPLVAGTLEPENIFTLDDHKVEQYRENIYGLTPNQILTSSYFGLHSTRAPNTGTLSDFARRKLVLPDEAATPSEEGEPEDRALKSKERARQMLGEIEDE